MSADSTSRRSITELRQMDEQTATHELTHAEYKRWESVNDHHDRAEEVRAEWQEDAEVVHDLIVSADVSDLASEITVFGNDLTVYYSAESDALREPVERLADKYELDTDDGELDDTLEADDVADDDREFVASALCDMIDAALVGWDGTDWGDLPREQKDSILSAARRKWQLDGLMDAWVEIQLAVEQSRDERLERVQKFRSPERRGDR